MEMVYTLSVNILMQTTVVILVIMEMVYTTEQTADLLACVVILVIMEMVYTLYNFSPQGDKL